MIMEEGHEMRKRKRVMVLVDENSHSKHAMMWALTHLTNAHDSFTLLHIIPPTHHHDPYNSNNSPNSLANSLASLCKASKPQVEVEALVIQGPKLGTVMSQVKKLEVTVLVLGQKKIPSSLLLSWCCSLCGGGGGGLRLRRSSSERFVEQCISSVDCWTVGVKRQSRGLSGYLITTRTQKDFWLLA